MECPACDNQLHTETHHDVELDVCGHCGGMWFDNFEVKKFDEAHEKADSLLEIAFKDDVQLDSSRDRKCPKCTDIILRRHFFGSKRKIEIDECASCGGVWLDQGELKEIRATYPTEKERKQAAIDYFNEVAVPELEKEHADDHEMNDRLRKLGKIIGMICPDIKFLKRY